LYADTSILSIQMVDSRINFKVREFMNGATLESIVMRAKSAAAKRDILRLDQGTMDAPRPGGSAFQIGISKDDVLDGIHSELEENKMQLAQYRVQNELKLPSDSIQAVDVDLNRPEDDPWSEPRIRPYQPRGALA
jgi:hypothetical protein